MDLVPELLEPSYYEERRATLLRLIKLAFIRKERRLGTRAHPGYTGGSPGVIPSKFLQENRWCTVLENSWAGFCDGARNTASSRWPRLIMTKHPNQC